MTYRVLTEDIGGRRYFVTHDAPDGTCCLQYERDIDAPAEFACPRCKRVVGFCQGADDNEPDLCNDCWDALHGSGVARLE